MTDNFDTTAWLAEMRAMESEGEVTPIQSAPHDVVLDIFTPVFLRRQAD